MGMLEDKEEIRELLARYNRAIDFPDPEGWVSLWTADGTMEFGGRPPIKGTDELRARAVGRPGGSLHLTTNAVIDIDGDVARVTSYLVLIGGQGAPGVQIAGRYDDVLRREDGRWLFALRALDPFLTPS